MQIQKSLSLCILSFFTMLFFSCEENESGVDIIQFQARFVSEVSSNVISFTNQSVGAESFLWDFGDGTTSIFKDPVKTYEAGGTYTVRLTARNDLGQTDSFEVTFVVEDPFDGGLVTNGDFEAGAMAWIVGVDDNVPAPVVTVDGNTYYEVNVTNPNPDQPFLVNLSQKLEIVEGNTYTLTFDAWSDVERTIIAGIGLSGGDFSNDSQIVNITTTPQQYQLTLSSAGFGAADARVLFDSNAEAGFVRIDNVSLFLQE
jgi:hypothetical protein